MLFFDAFGKNEFMKKILLLLVFLTLSLALVGVLTSPKNSTLMNSDYLRIHIRANSNDEIDQNIKYKIKDEFVNFLAPQLAFCNTKQEVVDMILSQKQNLENLANCILKDNGFYYSSKVKINQEMFPTRSYDGHTLESGIYDALIVELGSAKGDNWWCVIYPPLCFTEYSKSSSLSVVYKSKILEIIKQFFN